MPKDLDILKRLIMEADEDQEPEAEKEEEAPKKLTAFEKDPMGFILNKYHSLNELMSEMMTEDFKEFVDGIFIMAPKPTTFKIMLHNGQYFFLTYMMDDVYEATISGKRYYLKGLGEKERCMMAISRLLRFGSPLKTKGPEGAEQGTRENSGMEGDWAANGGAGGATPSEEPAPEGGESAEVDTTAGGPEELEENVKILEQLLLSEMAFTDFPKSDKEIQNKDIKKLYKVVTQFTDMEDPISLDPDKPNLVNITRKLQTDRKAIQAIKQLTGQDMSKGDIRWNGLKIKFGEGSRGGRGTKSKGFAFENSLISDLDKVVKEGFSKSRMEEFNHPELIKQMVDEFGLKKGNFTVSLDGSANKPRPLEFDGDSPKIGYSGETMAETVTDITIKKGTESYYLSAKFGGTLTFFNSGVTKIFPANEIKKGEITNENGVALLNTLGINNKAFCAVFNLYDKGKTLKTKPLPAKADVGKLQALVSSGIGSGYYYVQAGKGVDKFFKIDNKFNKKASTITSEPTVYYGGKDGEGKRIDVSFESAEYIFKVNIRNKQGGLYPSHIMCDYKAKK